MAGLTAATGEPRPRAAIDAAREFVNGAPADKVAVRKATQVGHLLRAAVNAARAAELNAGDDTHVGEASLENARRRATQALVDVLCRYPEAPTEVDRYEVLEWIASVAGGRS